MSLPRGSGAGTSASSTAVSTTFANDLLVGADLTVTGTTTGSGFTQRMLTVPDADILEDRIVTAVGSYAATAGIAPSGQWIMQLAAFKAATSGAPPPTPTAPSGLTATASGATGINLAWTAASETGGSIAQYLIERCHGRRLQQLRADRDLDDHVLREHRAQRLDQLQLSRTRQGCRGQHRPLLEYRQRYDRRPPCPAHRQISPRSPPAARR